MSAIHRHSPKSCPRCAAIRGRHVRPGADEEPASVAMVPSARRNQSSVLDSKFVRLTGAVGRRGKASTHPEGRAQRGVSKDDPACSSAAVALWSVVRDAPSALLTTKNQRASRWFPRRGETSRDDVLKQDRTAWSFEVEARPFKEKWRGPGARRGQAGCAAGAGSIFGNGLNVSAIRNAPRPMPNEPR